MFCSNCGNEIADKAIMCPKCGLAMENKKEISTGGIVAGYICSVLIPIIGIIIGIYALTKGRLGHGIGMIVSSLFWTSIWITLL